ncbi:MAG TPA: monovalent cation/H+ antiporter subunit D [Nitrosomonas nitrosa]|nr:monovalent cation/H+ antiporter subunit D [Nitrosomonas nitrosa]
MMTHLIIFPVLLPLAAGIILLLLRQRNQLLERGLSIISIVTQIFLAFQILSAVSHGDILVYALGDWSAPYGIILVADRLAAWMLLITALLSLFAMFYAIPITEQAGRHFHVLFQLQLFGLNGAFLTGDLFNLFVFFEILLIASYSLLLHGGGRLRTKAGLHFVVINLVGSTLFLFAVGILYGTLGTLNMADLAIKLARLPAEDVALVQVAGLLLFSVFALKAALVPLHLWLPSAYAHTSAPIAALFAIMTKVGAYSILRIYTLIFGAEAGLSAHLIEGWLLPLALITLLVGMLGVVASTHLRQQIAFLVVASVGTLLTAFGLNTQASIAAGLFYLPHSTFAIAAFFLLANSIAIRRAEWEDRLDVGPVIPHARLLGGLFFVAAMLLAGLPPLSGFIGKFMILHASLAHSALPWVMSVVLITSLLSLIALARTGSLLFYRAQPPNPLSNTASITTIYQELLPIISLLSLCMILVIWGGTITQFLHFTAEQLLQPSRYIEAVLLTGRN